MKSLSSSISVFTIGALVSGGVTWAFMRSGVNEATIAAADCIKELNVLKPEVSMLQSNLNIMRSSLEERITPIPIVTEVPTIKSKKTTQSQNTEAIPTDEQRDSERVYIDWRVNSIGKIVPLTEEQRNRLKQRFEQEAEINRKGLPRDERNEQLEGLPALSDIIGDENAKTYQQHVQAAFARAENDALEKEIVWLGRRLSLTPDQENQVRGVFIAADEAVKARRAENPQESNSPQLRMRQMLEETELRSTFIRNRLKPILTENQMTEFAKEEADSAAADMAMFHSS